MHSLYSVFSAVGGAVFPFLSLRIQMEACSSCFMRVELYTVARQHSHSSLGLFRTEGQGCAIWQIKHIRHHSYFTLSPCNFTTAIPKTYRLGIDFISLGTITKKIKILTVFEIKSFLE